QVPVELIGRSEVHQRGADEGEAEPVLGWHLRGARIAAPVLHESLEVGIHAEAAAPNREPDPGETEVEPTAEVRGCVREARQLSDQLGQVRLDPISVRPSSALHGQDLYRLV